MKKGTLLFGLGLAWAGLTAWDEMRKRQVLAAGPATGLLPDGRPGVALITGGSSGIGAAFARRLAGQGYDLVLVARREERLADFAGQLSRRQGARVETLAADLSEMAGIRQVEERIAQLDRLTLLINNAGFGTTGLFGKVSRDRHQEMMNVHMVASTRLSHAALPVMIARRSGGIINVASLAAFIPVPGGVNYSATKAYLVMFSEALNNECRQRGVHVQALCPGFTYTGFHGTDEFGANGRSGIPGFLWGPAEDVVDASLAALALGQPVCIPGYKNRAIGAIVRNMPTAALARFVIRQSFAPGRKPAPAASK